jgi:tetratricopeptide (TPR) repeat protein
VKAGIRHARGEIILLQGADDISLPNRADAALSILEAKPTAGIVITDALIIDCDSNLTGERHTHAGIDEFEVPLLQWKRNYCLGPTMAIRNRPDLLLSHGILEEIEDYQISLEFILSGWNIAIDNQPRVLYRIHKDNLSNNHRVIMERLTRCLSKYDPKIIFNELQRRGFTEHRINVALGVFELFRNRPNVSADFFNRAQNEYLPDHDLFEKKFYLGVIAWIRGRIQESRLNFKSAYKKNSTEPTVLNNLAVHMAISGNFEQAFDLLKKSIKLYPKYKDAHYNIKRLKSSNKNLRITDRILAKNVEDLKCMIK